LGQLEHPCYWIITVREGFMERAFLPHL
jgi:hypothetical protein